MRRTLLTILGLASLAGAAALTPSGMFDSAIVQCFN